MASQVGGTGSLQRAALALQHSLLPQAIPASEELEFAARYRAAGDDTDVGGDWYDVLPLGAGRIGLVVGDVMGRGVSAAAVTAQLRTAVRTCARLDLAPVEVMEVLDGLVADLAPHVLDRHFATCLYAVFDPHTRDLTLSSAGHLLPLLRANGTGFARLDLDVGPPLGLGEPPVEGRVRLAPGTVLALFTDGLIRVRGGDVDAGLDWLCTSLSQVDGQLDDGADRVLAALPDDPRRDDVALLLVRVRPDVDTRSQTVVLSVPRERGLLVDVRQQARAAMHGWALLDDVVDTATLLASELVTNGVLHGSGPVELRLRLTRDRLVLEAADTGHLMPRRRLAATDEEGGRGLQLVASLASRWGARQTDDGKVVWAELDLAQA